MYKLLDVLLRRIVRAGNLQVIDPQGVRHRYGNGSGPGVVARIVDRWLVLKLLLDPHLALGEGYMSGRLRVERGRLYDLLAMLASNVQQQSLPYWTAGFDAVRFMLRRITQLNPVHRARRNVAHHYDIDGAIYDLFLDRDRQYSCAYFPHDMSLDAAQLAKKRHLAAKLALKPGHRVLDIGSGWGGLALYLAKTTRANVTGVTLSTEQFIAANARATSERLEQLVHFELQDYRRVGGCFDRIVSVGMFEHVGVNHYQTYFSKLRQLLADDGVAVIHTIGRVGPPTATHPFISKYIFPGGYIPALSEMVPAIERSGLAIADIEVLRLHYAKTLHAWRERFLANWDKAVALRGERFSRMWEFYLAASEVAFRYHGLVVFQVQIVKQMDALPLTRAHMMHAEQKLRECDAMDAGPRLVAEHFATPMSIRVWSHPRTTLLARLLLR